MGYAQQTVSYMGRVVRAARAVPGQLGVRAMRRTRGVAGFGVSCTISRASQVQQFVQRQSAHYGIIHSGHMVECPT